MFSGLSRLRLLSVLLPFVLVAAPLGGRPSARRAAPVASTVLWGVACLSADTCVAVGWNGTILRTTDAGSTWISQTSGTTNTLGGVACPSPSTCLAVGDSGTIVRSTDGGSTWRRQPSGPPMLLNTLNGVACLSPLPCLAVGGTCTISGSITICLGAGPFGTLLRSTDGRSTWGTIR